MERKLERLLSEFQFSTLGEVHPAPAPSASRSAVSPSCTGSETSDLSTKAFYRPYWVRLSV